MPRGDNEEVPYNILNRMNQKLTEQEAYNKLSLYTLAHSSPAFIHQHVVDAFAAQYADDKTKPITIIFALVGLYLCVEKNHTGKKIQFAHMKLAGGKKSWPAITLPADRGAITVFDVLKAHPGNPRDEAIKKWCASVWEAYRDSRETIVELVRNELFNN